jgi:hypothetical protein
MTLLSFLQRESSLAFFSSTVFTGSKNINVFWKLYFIVIGVINYLELFI